MAITRPQLPPKAGYVEIVDASGRHVYKPTPETLKKLEAQQNLQTVQTNTDTILGTIDTGSKEALEFRKAIQLFATSLTDEQTIIEIPSIYPEYRIGVAYQVKDVFRYGTNSVGDPQLYQVLQAHTSAAEWTPDSAVSLYKKIGISDDGTPLWVQPLGATDAYNIGDRVIYNGQKYESLINANVWAPDVYPAGWQLIESETEEPEPEEPSADRTPEFVQPTGAHDAYNKGDQVMYNGQKYESLIDGNVWSPDANPSGWQLVN